MKKKEQEFKMGVNWGNKFVSPKKIVAGWKLTKVDENTNVVIKPDGTIFALHNTKTGLVHTTANVIDVQW